jgi:hypothetical protein
MSGFEGLRWGTQNMWMLSLKYASLQYFDTQANITNHFRSIHVQNLELRKDLRQDRRDSYETIMTAIPVLWDVEGHALWKTWRLKILL